MALTLVTSTEERPSEQVSPADLREAIRRLVAVTGQSHESLAHLDRTATLCEAIANELGLPAGECERIGLASRLHDLGKSTLPATIVEKPGPLTPEDRRELQRHAEAGWRMLSGSGSDLLDLSAVIALTHHERWDGSGYPLGLAGEEIPLPGRIAAVADVFDALTSDRVYRAAIPLEAAVEMIRAECGSHFDPRVVDAFLATIEYGASPTRGWRLSPRERQVLSLLRDGKTAVEIAEELVLSRDTVQTHVKNAMGKLGAKTRVHAVVLAMERREINR
jgi:HD-GYP domain-containing protein (c-di-GMP phosphodiesterase class II)